MNGAGRDARRRNRNIGTKKSGHGKDNRLVIPQSWADDRVFHERLDDPVVFERTIQGLDVTFLVEPPLPGHHHACTPRDICRVLGLAPLEHLRPIELIVLRQPKRKERILSPVWGRLVYWSEIGRYSGPAIHLEAQPLGSVIEWSKSLSPAASAELELLAEDGHKIRSGRRCHYIETSPRATRNTQLYRTLPHELGHYVDYLVSVEIPSDEGGGEWEPLDQRYRAKPTKDKEAFADRYAAEFCARHREAGKLPFGPLDDAAQLERLGLEPRWFVLDEAPPRES